MATTTIDEEAIKSRQQATWSSGDYSVIGTTLQITGEIAVRSCRCRRRRAGARRRRRQRQRRVRPRRAVVLPSPRPTTSPSCSARARVRAAAEGLKLDVREGDAEALPFAGATFDVVLSTFGVMFTPNQERAAAELSECAGPVDGSDLRAGRRTDSSGEMFKIVGRYASPAGRCAFARSNGEATHAFGSCSGAECDALDDATPGLRVPVSLARALARRVPELLRADPQGVRLARPGRTRRVRT